MRPVDLTVLHNGSQFTIAYAIDANGKSVAQEFYDGLTVKEQAKFFAYFSRIGDGHKITNPTKFKHLEDKLYEFKQHQKRLACFQNGRYWFIVLGITKKKDRWEKQDIDTAKRIMNEHNARWSAT